MADVYVSKAFYVRQGGEHRGFSVLGKVAADHRSLAEVLGFAESAFIGILRLLRRICQPPAYVAEGQQLAAPYVDGGVRSGFFHHLAALQQLDGKAFGEVGPVREADTVGCAAVGRHAASDYGQGATGSVVGGVIVIQPGGPVFLEYQIRLVERVAYGLLLVAAEFITVEVAADAESYESAEVVENEMAFGVVVSRHQRNVGVVEPAVIVKVAGRNGRGRIRCIISADVSLVRGTVVGRDARHGNCGRLAVGADVRCLERHGLAVGTAGSVNQ